METIRSTAKDLSDVVKMLFDKLFVGGADRSATWMWEPVGFKALALISQFLKITSSLNICFGILRFGVGQIVSVRYTWGQKEL